MAWGGAVGMSDDARWPSHSSPFVVDYSNKGMHDPHPILQEASTRNTGHLIYITSSFQLRSLASTSKTNVRFCLRTSKSADVAYPDPFPTPVLRLFGRAKRDIEDIWLLTRSVAAFVYSFYKV